MMLEKNVRRRNNKKDQRLPLMWPKCHNTASKNGLYIMQFFICVYTMEVSFYSADFRSFSLSLRTHKINTFK